MQIKKSTNIKKMGRLVQNHGTNIDGLMKWLRRIAVNQNIRTPGSYPRQMEKVEKLVLKKLLKLREGYKLLARKGKLVQEVFSLQA